MPNQLDNPPQHRPWVPRLVTTVAAWFVAFLLVMVLLTFFGHQLESLPHALNALIFTGLLVPVMGNLVMPVLSDAVARKLPTSREHPQIQALPHWPAKTIAVLSTMGLAPHAIPVSAPLRTENGRILLSLHRSRDSLVRLREHPQVALTILAQGDIAVTARGRARIVQESMASAPDYVAIAIEVEHLDDHRQAEFVVETGVDRRWVDDDEQRALRERVEALATLASNGA